MQICLLLIFLSFRTRVVNSLFLLLSVFLFFCLFNIMKLCVRFFLSTLICVCATLKENSATVLSARCRSRCLAKVSDRILIECFEPVAEHFDRLWSCTNCPHATNLAGDLQLFKTLFNLAKRFLVSFLFLHGPHFRATSLFCVETIRQEILRYRNVSNLTWTLDHVPYYFVHILNE